MDGDADAILPVRTLRRSAALNLPTPPDPTTCVAIEDSANGLRAAAAARMRVVAVPNPHFPPPADALALAAATVRTPGGLTPELVDQL